MPEMRIFWISCEVLIMIAILLLPRLTKLPQGRLNRCGNLFDCTRAVDLAEAPLPAVVLDHWSSQRVVGLHALGKRSLRIVGAMLKRASIEVTDARGLRRLRIDIVDMLADRADSAAGNAAQELLL